MDEGVWMLRKVGAGTPCALRMHSNTPFLIRFGLDLPLRPVRAGLRQSGMGVGSIFTQP